MLGGSEHTASGAVRSDLLQYYSVQIAGRRKEAEEIYTLAIKSVFVSVIGHTNCGKCKLASQLQFRKGILCFFLLVLTNYTQEEDVVVKGSESLSTLNLIHHQSVYFFNIYREILGYRYSLPQRLFNKRPICV